MPSVKSGERQQQIQTKRLRLHRARPDDLSAIHAIMSDPETMRYWSTPAHTDLAETRSWFASMLAAQESEDSDEFVVEHNGVAIGKMGAWRLPEIGFFLRRDCWGGGFATEALEAYINYAKECGLRELTADVDPRNVACFRLLLKCGFVETGRRTATYVVNGVPCDSVYLKLDLQA